MTEYYKDMLEKGLEYQDFVTRHILREMGIPISSYASRKYQIEVGETVQGVEIKFDDKMAATGNVYIEIAEKTNAANDRFVPSGIYREDNTWLFLIGNYHTIYLFSKKFLIQLHKAKRFDREVETPTSRAFLLGKEGAKKYCIKQINISNGDESQMKLDWEEEGVI